jgi:FKBP-type peptidyl-prolyl cis-trans isomerase FklB
MKNTIILLAIAVAASSCNNTNKSSSEFNLKSETDSVSYAIGHAIAQTLINQNKQIQNQSPDLNMDIINQSILANFTGDNKSMIDSAVSQQIIQNYFMKKQQLEEGNVKESGMQFLEENKNKEGIQVTESGLQYTVIFEGDGKQPSETSNVTVHYHGTTPEGEVFDSSVERGEPATFGLNQVIKGWTEGVQLMKEGAKYKFFIPQELAYGANPRPGGPIKPYMPLVFEIELISVND